MGGSAEHTLCHLQIMIGFHENMLLKSDLVKLGRGMTDGSPMHGAEKRESDTAVALVGRDA